MIIGIDLGTTYSAAAHVAGGLPRLLSAGQERLLPSVVGFTEEGKLLVGTPARNQYVLHPELTVRSVKRLMGTDETLSLHGRPYRPAEISALILAELKRRAQSELGQPVERAVITVPAYFSDAARQATRQAGELAGFTVERTLNEPTAAALAYGLDRIGVDQKVAVYDLGGGTFDVSVVELSQGVLEVRSSHGNTHLGGDDFDQALAEHLAGRFQKEHGVDPRPDRRAWARLLRAAEQAKIALSTQPFVPVREEYLLQSEGGPLHLDLELERQTFEGLIERWIQQTLESVDRALADAQLQAGDLDRLLFVGGSTRIPLVWERVAEHTGLEPQVEVHPDEAVALGAGVEAAIVAGEPIEAILVDVTPHSLGIEVVEVESGIPVEDRYSVVIHRNTPLPVGHAEVFYAMHPGQKEAKIKVYQGEDPVASHNTLLGELHCTGLKSEEAGELPRITVAFDLDISGILHVSATDRGSAQVQEATLQAAHQRLAAAEQAESARHLASLEQATAQEDPLIARARGVIAARGEEVAELSRVVNALEQARQEGRTEEATELGERLLDLLYENE
ncbi:MAG: Hsp70 family protein [Candidatus Latescibacterota bacterium]